MLHRLLAALALGDLLWSAHCTRADTTLASLSQTSDGKAKVKVRDCPPNYEPTLFNCPLFPTNLNTASSTLAQWNLPTKNDVVHADDKSRRKKFMICGMARPNVGQNPKCGEYEHRKSSDGAILSILTRAKSSFTKQRRSIQAEKVPITLASLDDHELPAITDGAKELGFVHSVSHIIPDFTAPSLDNLGRFVNRVLGAEPDTHFLVHCGGGMGRTGLFLIALYTKLFKLNGKSLFVNYRKSIDLADNPTDYTAWYQPLEEALLWVQFTYDHHAGEFNEVKLNYPTLAEYTQSLYDSDDPRRPSDDDIRGHEKDYQTTASLRRLFLSGRAERRRIRHKWQYDEFDQDG